jgi:hypothetical protein
LNLYRAPASEQIENENNERDDKQQVNQVAANTADCANQPEHQ